MNFAAKAQGLLTTCSASVDPHPGLTAAAPAARLGPARQTGQQPGGEPRLGAQRQRLAQRGRYRHQPAPPALHNVVLC